MSIRPVDFNGMIQNTTEASASKTQEDQKPVVQQEVASVTISKEAQQQTTSVHQKATGDQERYELSDDESSGNQYSGNRREKREKKDEEFQSDGSVTVKNEHGSFDIKI